jgi:hypothetical protein
LTFFYGFFDGFFVDTKRIQLYFGTEWCTFHRLKESKKEREKERERKKERKRE